MPQASCSPSQPRQRSLRTSGYFVADVVDRRLPTAGMAPATCALIAALGIAGCRSGFEEHPVVDGGACSTPACTDLVAYWKLDDDLTNAISGLTLTLTGNVEWTEARGGKVLDFKRTNGMPGLAMASSEPALDNLSSLTFTAWINPRSNGSGGLGPVLAKGGSGPQAAKRWLLNGFACMFCLELTVNGSPETERISYAGVPPGWQFIAATFDSHDTAHLYLKAEEMVYSGSVSPGVVMAADDSMTAYAIGGWPATNSTAGFDGMIDEIRIYRRALTPEELRAIFLAP